MTFSRKLCILALTILLPCAAVHSADAADYPKGPINFIVAYGAGGGSDVGARILAAVAEKHLGVPVVVQNKPGAGGGIGWTALTASKPDGYTIALINIPSMILLPLQGKAPYKLDDILPVMQLVDDPALLMVKKGGKFKNFDDFLAYAKANPGKLTVGTSGAGSDSHVVVEMINDKLGIKLNPVPFSGGTESMTSMLGGHTDASLPKVSEAISALESGEGLLLTTFTPKRLPQYPDLPTSTEVGIGINYSASRGVAVPKGTPPEIVKILHDKLVQATKEPEYIEKMKNAGLPMEYRGGKDFHDFYMQQYKDFEPAVKKLKM